MGGRLYLQPCAQLDLMRRSQNMWPPGPTTYVGHPCPKLQVVTRAELHVPCGGKGVALRARKLLREKTTPLRLPCPSRLVPSRLASAG